MKIDTAKAFDTLNWSFVVKVLKASGFNSKFCNWIRVILNSTSYLSLSMEDNMVTFLVAEGSDKGIHYPLFYFALHRKSSVDTSLSW